MGLDFFLEGFASFAGGRDDEDGVITRDGAGDFRKFGAVEGGCEWLRATGRGLENEKILRGANIQEEFAESAGKGRNGGSLIRSRGRRAIALPGFNELEFLEVARKCGLGDAHALLREAAAQIFLIRDPFGGDQAKDLSVTKCLSSAHSISYTYDCIFIQSNGSGCQSFFEGVADLSGRRKS